MALTEKVNEQGPGGKGNELEKDETWIRETRLRQVVWEQQLKIIQVTEEKDILFKEEPIL